MANTSKSKNSCTSAMLDGSDAEGFVISKDLFLSEISLEISKL